MKKYVIYFILLSLSFLKLNGQNLITVPFNNGFVGDNGGSNSALNCYYHSGTGGLGFTNVQFAQNSTSTIFTAQGNDIIGMVLITDNSGVEHTINGFIKWRSPSGNSPYVMIFEPATGSSATLATNGFNGSATYTITDTKYIGLVFNGNTLTISPVPGTVTGNAATNGLLDALNAYLATFGKLTVSDVTVNEGAGTATVTVTLSASSTNVITVAYTTSDGTAAVGSDYTATSGTLTFAAGQTNRTFTIPIINDAIIESNETINITLSDPTNASILDGAGVVTIVDNDICTVGTPVGSVTVQPTCATTTGTIVFTTQSGVEYSINGTTYQSSATFTGVAAGTYTLKVRSTTDNTCTATGATVTVNAAPSTPSTPVGSVTVQPTCATTTGTIVFTTQSGVEYSINGTTYQAGATFTGVAAGTYTLKVRSTTDNTCTATGTTVTVNAAAGAPSTPVGSVTVQPTCATTTGTIVFTTQSGVEYSINGTTYQSSATFTGVASGTYTLKVRSTTDNTCTATGATVTVNAAPSTPSTPAGSVTVQPTCATTTATIVFTTQSGVQYSIDGTTYQSSATFTGVASGTYTLKVRSTTDNSCTATGATVTVNAAPSAPSTPVGSVTVQPTCATTTGTIVFTTQSGVEYSINGTTYQSSATFTGVAPGTYTLRVRSTTDNSCTATGSTVTVNAIPSLSSIQLSDISVNENQGYAIFDVVGPANSYVSLFLNNQTALGLGVDYGAVASQLSLGQSNMEYSNNNGVTWTIYQDYAQLSSCGQLKVRTPINDDNLTESNETFNLVVNPIAVNLGTISLYDVNYNTIDLSGLVLESGTAEAVNAVYKKTNAITVNSQAIDVRIKIIAKSNIGTNSNDYVFDNDTSNSVRFQSEINSTSSSGSFVDYKIEFFKSGLNVPVALTNFYVTGVDIDGNSASSKEYIELSNFSSYTINNPTGLTIGISPTNSQNTRFTGIDNSLSGITFENTASFIANYQSPLTELNFRKGVTGTSTSRQFSVSFGVLGGVFSNPIQVSNDISVTGIATIIDNDNCILSTPVGSVTVQPTCATTTGTIVFTTQSGVEYSINGTTYQAGATFTGVAAGSYTLKVRSTTDNSCTATGATVTVNAAPSTPSTPVGSVSVQPTCATTTGTIVFTTQSGVEYSINGTTYQAGATFTGVAAGSYTLKVRSTTDNTCTATGATVTVNAAPSTPSTPVGSVTVQPTCATTTGTIVFTTQSGVEYSINGTTYQTSATFTGVAAGSYTLKVRSTTDNTCTATGATVTVNAAPSAPSTPTGSVTVQPTCATTTGTIVFTTQSGVEYSIDGTNYQSSATFTGVATGTYTLRVRSTTDNSCTATGATVILYGPICAIADTAGPINGLVGATTASVLTNDTLNGVAVTASAITLTGVTVPTGLTLNSNGTITVAPNTPAGTLTLTYKICENLNPTNCDTATVTITVAAAVIDAIADTAGPINGLVGATTASVLTNDTLNGVAVTASAITLTGVTVPTGLTLNSNGTITVAPNTPAGTLTLTYKICENLNPTNCDTATVTITVAAAVIDAIADTAGPINGLVGATTASVLTNDTLNGVAVTASAITLTGVTVPTGLTLNSNGTITVAPNTPAGTLTLTYKICENLNPTNCDTATVTITVAAAVIDAIADTAGPINGLVGATTASVLTNDTLNGVAVTASAITLTGVTVPSGLTLNPNGTITIAPNTPAGTLTLTYKICENLNPTNCDTATVTITVAAAVIDAIADTAGPINGLVGATTASVLTNDTLNGVAVTASAITLTGVTVPTGLTLNSNGTITIAPNTPAGTLTLTYKICENLNPTNCDTATVTITVAAAVIDAIADTAGPINGLVGATTASVLTNDTLNGVAVTASAITLTGVTVPSGLTLNPNGTITIAPNTPAGTLTLTYKICENLNPTNCDTATVTITVAAAVIDAIADTAGPINGLLGATTASVLTNDTLNGVAVTASAITLTGVTVPTSLTLNSNGTITVAPNTPAGTLTLTYKICENLNPTNCDTATVTIIIGSCLEFPINDCDGDGVTNGQEILNGTNPSDSCSFVLTSQTVTPSSQWLAFDCDGDGVTNGQEVLDGTNSLDPCDFEEASITLTQSASWNNADCDGDGVTNGQEIIDGTDPADGCDAIMANATLPLSQEFLEGDCDGDGLTNGEEIGPNPNEPFDPNGNGIPDYLEINNHTPSDDDLEIFNLVTPNGDGDNDVLVIRNIERYPENSLEVYNRWGVQVFGVEGYGQNGKFFRGISEGRTTINQASELPVGTYWYVLKYKNTTDEWKQRGGYLYLNK